MHYTVLTPYGVMLQGMWQQKLISVIYLEQAQEVS